MDSRNVRCYGKGKDPKGCPAVGLGLINGLVRDWLNGTLTDSNHLTVVLVVDPDENWDDQPETHALPKPIRSRRRRGAARDGENWDDRNDRPETQALPIPKPKHDRNDRPEMQALPIPKPVRSRRRRGAARGEENWDDRNDRPEERHRNTDFVEENWDDQPQESHCNTDSVEENSYDKAETYSNTNDLPTICKYCNKNLSLSLAARHQPEEKHRNTENWVDQQERRRNTDSTTDSADGLVPINSGYIPEDGENWEDVLTSSVLASVQSDLKNKCVILPIPPMCVQT